MKVGDRVWLYVPAVKVGRSKKLSSLWRGPYTIIGRTSSVNYRIQLIGSTVVLVVHRNRLKLCHGEPGVTSAPRTVTSRPRKQASTQPMLTARATLQSRRTFADVTAGRPATQGSGGYTSSMDLNNCCCSDRPQRIRRPPDRYGSYLVH